MNDLKNAHKFFWENQFPIIKSNLQRYDMDSGKNFIDFLLKILPNSVMEEICILVHDGSDSETERIKKVWDQKADSWTHMESLYNYFIIMSLTMSWIKKINPIYNVLSLGSGPGLHELFIEHNFREKIVSFYCTDVAPKMIEQVKLNQERYCRLYNKKSILSSISFSMKSIPFANESADLIISTKAIQWCENIKKALCEIYRVLKRNGSCILIVSDKTTTLDGSSVYHKFDPYAFGSNLIRNGCMILDFKEINFPIPLQENERTSTYFGLFFKKM